MVADLPDQLPKHRIVQDSELGPAMSSLTDRQRKFVWELLANGGAQVDAYIAAGYKNSGNRDALRGNASQLANSDSIQAAILEEGHKFAGARIGVWLAQVEAIALDSTQSGAARLKALDMLLSRGGSIQKTETIVTSRHELTEGQLLTKVTAAAEKLGLDPRATLRKYGYIDADFDVVSDKVELIETTASDKPDLIDDWMTWKPEDASASEL